MATATKNVPAPKTASKGKGATSAKTAAPVVVKTPKEKKAGFSKPQERILRALAKSKTALGREALKKASGIASGLYRHIGATSEDAPGGLVGAKLVLLSDAPEGQRGVRFALSAKGKEVASKLPKA